MLYFKVVNSCVSTDVKRKPPCIGGMELVSLSCNVDHSWYKPSTAMNWYQFHATDKCVFYAMNFRKIHIWWYTQKSIDDFTTKKWFGQYLKYNLNIWYISSMQTLRQIMQAITLTLICIHHQSPTHFSLIPNNINIVHMQAYFSFMNMNASILLSGESH